MRQIQNTIITFRCTNDLKERLVDYGYDHELHVSQIIRRACNDLLLQDNRRPRVPPREWLAAKSNHE